MFLQKTSKLGAHVLKRIQLVTFSERFPDFKIIEVWVLFLVKYFKFDKFKKMTIFIAFNLYGKTRTFISLTSNKTRTFIILKQRE
jgi:hypothetical protein